MLIKKFFILFFLFIVSSISIAKENIFYVLHNRAAGHPTYPSTLMTIAQNSKSIDILISQAYFISAKGVVAGFINPDILTIARSRSIKLMAMVTNIAFDKNAAHIFLSNRKAQENALNGLISICKQDHLYGLQFDFENINILDRDRLSDFYQLAANKLHANHLALSIAVPPVVSDGPFSSDYYKKLYQNYGGAYDLKRIGSIADFVTVMAYDQHIGRITPGPVASERWVDAVLQHTLKSITPGKLSLGIPTYSSFWYTGKNSTNSKISLQNAAISYDKVLTLVTNNKSHVQWDNINKINYTIYDRHWLNQYIFIEDARSFKAKLALAKKYHLRGVSVFRLGIEDPAIWHTL